MSYKTILVHVDESKHLGSRLSVATQIAMKEQAHLIGAAATGVSRFMDTMAVTNVSEPMLQPYLETLRQRADRGLDTFEKEAKEVGLTSYEKRLVEDEAAGGIGFQGRYCDLVIVGQEDLDEPSPAVMPGFPEYVTMNSGSPTLVVPFAGSFPNIGERILIAWNASSQAMHAVRGALPFLRNARNVDVAVYNASRRPNVYGEEPGADIALYLARHGVKVNVMQEEIGREVDVGNAILALADMQKADMIVMGCYGHSRFRELILGGVTRVMLQSMSLPVLMSY